MKITPDSKVKVLDFGLAKAMSGAAAETTLSNSPTLLSGSMGGMIVGTAAYMSPEQARGKNVDRRADMWAFGCVLYETFSCQYQALPAFRSQSQSICALLLTAQAPPAGGTIAGMVRDPFGDMAAKIVLQAKSSDGQTVRRQLSDCINPSDPVKDTDWPVRQL